jgi:quinol monooxygenase YgiN
MSAVARYGKAVAHPGHGEELAGILLAAADGMSDSPGCELYLVSAQKGEPDIVWVTELWQSQADLDASVKQIQGSDSVARAMSLVQSWEMIELDLLGGKGPRPAAS